MDAGARGRPTRVVGEWWFVDTVDSISNGETCAAAFEVRDGDNYLLPSAQTPNRFSLPALAP